jgi:hypothetical protein
MTILKKNRNTKTYKMIKIQTITQVPYMYTILICTMYSTCQHDNSKIQLTCMRGPRNIFCVSVYLMTVLFLNLILNKCNVK